MSDESLTPRWWAKDPEVAAERGRYMVNTAKLLETRPEEQDRADCNLVNARMYENAPLPSLYHFGGPAAQAAGYSRYNVQQRTAWNVLRSACDTAKAQVTRNRPRPRFLTTDGTFRQKRKAKKLTQFCDGLFQEAKVYPLTKQVFRDAEVFDAGGIQVLIEDARVRFQRVLSCECTVDMNEAQNGDPRTLYRHRPMDREVALAKWGGKEGSERSEAIRMAHSIDPFGIGGYTNMIMIREAWHLASKKGAGDGRHVIAVEGTGPGCTLFDEEWPKTYFPILWFRWSTSLGGFWGQSLAEQAAPAQYEIDKLLVRIERSQRLASVPRLAIPRGAKVIKSQITNDEASMIDFTGPTPPAPLTWPALTPEVYNQLNEHVQKIYDLAGISRQAASGQKEAGVVSAVAIRESLDIQQTNLAPTQQDWEQFHVDLARIAVDFARDIASKRDDRSYEVAAPIGRRGFLESVDWKDVNVPEDEYVIEVYPTSLLPTTPAGRLETVQDMVKSGLWSPERGAAALDDLDVDSNESLEQASERLLQQQFEEMLYEGKPQHPDEFTDQERAIKLGAQYIVMGQLEKAPEKNVDLCRRFLDEVKAIQGALQPLPGPTDMQPAQPPGMAPPGPGAVPGGPPGIPPAVMGASPSQMAALPGIGLAPPPGTLSPLVGVS